MTKSLEARIATLENRWQETADVSPVDVTPSPVDAPPIADWIAGEVTIEDVQGESVSIIPFALWPAQRDALDVITSQNQVIILKARQLGMSWLCIAYALWLCLFHGNRLVMVFSKDQDSANGMIGRARGIYQRLADKRTALVTDNVTEIGWSNGSRIKAFAATKHAGSSFTATFTILDEFAKMDYAESLYTAVKPTINDGGKMAIISTGNGEGNPFHKLWQAAEKRQNNFVPLFLPWWSRPGRTVKWYAAVEADAISSAYHKQEYPAEPAEAFTSVGEDRFLPSMLLWDACQETLPPLTAHEQMIIAIDAAISGDSFGLIGVTAHPTKPGVLAVRIVHEWIPPKGGTIDYYGDASNPGPDWLIRNVLVTDYAVIQICYDPYQLHALCSKLVSDNVIWCMPFIQGPRRLEADKNLLDLITARRIVHDGNPALRRHIDAANRRPDLDSRKLRIVKREASRRIDLAICCSMAALIAADLALAG